MDNRIEEVKKKLLTFSACGSGRVWDRPLNELLDIFAKEICQLFPQPLDDKELREKTARMLYFGFEEFEVGSVAEVTWREAPQARRDIWLKQANQILALLQPKIEEARKEEHKSLISSMVDEGNDAYKAGAKQERERIQRELAYDRHTLGVCNCIKDKEIVVRWSDIKQALKGWESE